MKSGSAEPLASKGKAIWIPLGFFPLDRFGNSSWFRCTESFPTAVWKQQPLYTDGLLPQKMWKFGCLRTVLSCQGWGRRQLYCLLPFTHQHTSMELDLAPAFLLGLLNSLAVTTCGPATSKGQERQAKHWLALRVSSPEGLQW